MQRFLGRVFIDPAAPWILKGGGGLLVRLPGARQSRDIDLLHLDAGLDRAVDELRQLGTAVSTMDPFVFQIEIKGRDFLGATEGMKLKATPYMGVTKLQAFPVDLAVHRELVGDIDRITPTPVVEIDDVAALPEFSCYPLADQIADKVAAMYERHGPEGHTPSTRWRDLVDLLLITREFAFDAGQTIAALEIQCVRRMFLELPGEVRSPGPEWVAGYGELARTTTLPTELSRLDAALECLGECLNSLLDGTITAGTWNPSSRKWDQRRQF
ncbi:nucleotidyl transferase AbiEii/AbiGii toxin family protein [Nocardia sp. NPDC060256]|uniref:nucleotidyl transferase AbiEii/AbiGii toxin family protein n=1 Tax=unclassified Nocardia TaxID=2637762 RepID=UPI00365F5801